MKKLSGPALKLRYLLLDARKLEQETVANMKKFDELRKSVGLSTLDASDSERKSPKLSRLFQKQSPREGAPPTQIKPKNFQTSNRKTPSKRINLPEIS